MPPKSLPRLQDWAYAAGILDGEGSIILRHESSNAIGLQIRVGMRGVPVITWLQQTFGGAIYIHAAKTGMHSWNPAPDDRKWFLDGVIEFLQLKSRQAEIALAFLETLTPKEKRGGGIPLSDEVNLLREGLLVMLREEHALWKASKEEK